jgi:hypothetical protein
VPGADLVDLPVHAGGRGIVDLDPVHAQIAVARIGILRVDTGQGDKTAAIVGPALENRDVEQCGEGLGRLLARAGFFKAVVITKGRDPAVYTYPGVALGSANSVVGWDPDLSPQVGDRDGLFRIPIMSRGERAQVELQNETPLPCKFSTCEWVGEVTSLARR